MFGRGAEIAHQRFLDFVKIAQNLFLAILEDLNEGRKYVNSVLLALVHYLENYIDIKVSGLGFLSLVLGFSHDHLEGLRPGLSEILTDVSYGILRCRHSSR